MPRKKREKSLAKFRVDPQQLKKACEMEEIGIQVSTEVEPLSEFIGQERAHHAFTLGLQIKGSGYNIYAAGPPGTGKRTMIQAYLERIAKQLPTPNDWCYVYNFEDPIAPKALSLPAGKGKELQKDMENLVEEIQNRMQNLFESEAYATERDALMKSFEERHQRLIQEFQERAKARGFIVQFTPKGVVVTPHLQGRPLSPEEFEALPQEFKQRIQQERERLDQEIKGLIRELRQIEREAQERLKQLDQEAFQYTIEPLFQDLFEKYADLPEVRAYLEQVQKDMLEHVDVFKPKPTPPLPIPIPIPQPAETSLKRYRVNVLVDHSDAEGAPVVFEPIPNYVNLVGRIEKEVHMGALHTDFTMIHAGALHRANGGFLVIEMEELLRQPYAYPALKKALKTGQILIEDLGETLGLITTRVLKPEPIPLQVKVILMGDPLLYHLAYLWDPDFRELFKVKADFGVTMDRTPENIAKYTAFIAGIVKKEALLPFSAEAMARVIEYSSRIVSDQRKLSTKFSEIVDILREADFWAREAGAEMVQAEHVVRAIEEKRFRSNLLEERIQEMIARGTLLVDVEGERVGVVNGLSVLDLGDFSFGRPVRITATVGGGKEGVLDIEREVGLGGKIHSKGVLILSGYLSETFGEKEPITLSARIAFEQSYSEIEGDSASSTELYALMSALSGLPIRQDLAVTGSVNQKGEVQPVGGINEKIEGFYRICKVKGLTGTQGVLIPRRNLENLMLHDEVVQAVREGKFHIYAVDHVEEGIEILTGVPAGRKPDGTFEKGSVFARIAERLEAFKEAAKEREKAKPSKKRTTRRKKKA